VSGLGEVPAQRQQEMTLKREWTVEMIGNGDALITCGHCKNSAIVHWPTLRKQSEFKTRPCFYCFKTGKIPASAP
jgi:hypothetical protein